MKTIFFVLFFFISMAAKSQSFAYEIKGQKNTRTANITMIQWRQVSGPVNVTIVHPDSLNTEVTGFNTVGEYQFELCLFNLYGAGCDTMKVTVLDNPLPVKYEYFRGYPETNFNQLEWKTSYETNNQIFYIQSSPDGFTWTDIGSVTPNITGRYNYKDIYYYDLTYYRLKQVDRSGLYSYSNVLSLTNKSAVKISVQNPVTGGVFRMNIFSPKRQTATVTVYSSDGKKVATFTAICSQGLNTLTYPLKTIAKGVYMAQISFGDITRQEKFYNL